MDEIRILQLGNENWSELYCFPENAKLTYAQDFTEIPTKPYDVVFWDRQPKSHEYEALQKATKAYTLFVTENVVLEGKTRYLYGCKCGQILRRAQVQDFLSRELRFYFPDSYGEKFQMRYLTVAEHFSGSVKWNGNHDLTMQGDFGLRMRQAAFWRNTIPLAKNQTIDLWLEYERNPHVEICMEITQFAAGSRSNIINSWRFNEMQLHQVVSIEGDKGEGPIFVSINARGEGTLRIIALHDRYSRGSHGHFLPGGVRYVTTEREEIFAYFDPGNRKPPLTVYFSGYKTREGFEGYKMMRKLGCPFLLFSDSRLEGGCCYMGSEKYETVFVDAIRKYMRALAFTPDQVILSGLSMGSCGALYYGCDIRPHAVIVGKPVISLGNVAANEKRLRPGGFPTSLDMLRYLSGDTDELSVQALNQKFWNKFDTTDWSNTKFIIAYMTEDDYDTDAYAAILEHMQSDGVQVYGKGIQGRHNDNTPAIVDWFVDQYHKVLSEDF